MLKSKTAWHFSRTSKISAWMVQKTGKCRSGTRKLDKNQMPSHGGQRILGGPTEQTLLDIAERGSMASITHEIQSDTRFRKPPWGTSLVVQWLRICLPIQSAQARSLSQEDPICQGATNLVCSSYRGCRLQLRKPVCPEHVLLNKRSLTVRSPRTATKSSRRLLQPDKAHKQQRRPSTTINK